MPKTYSVIVTPKAETDLFAIYNYIAGHSGHARAGDFVERIEAHCQGLRLFPERGTRRESLLLDLRITTHRHQATIAYLIDHARVQVAILRVFGAGQNYKAALRE